ncbi:hypothetical protein AN963_09520 [Brevibacillus choshinensis]|uniref:EamA domain-containing protein n=1 Tax=Brevibacillus choshinensis TaxID=54911 RepID=A0ABR5NF85_BRECH|nr:hypothetical protein AN963_09520 [Brevibacillus choshinensis]
MERFKGMVYLFCAFSFAGSSVIAARFFQSSLGTFTISAVSLLLALLCLLPLSGKKLMRTIRLLSAKEWIVLTYQALFGVFLFRMFLLYGLDKTSAAEAGILTGATPAVTVLLATVLLKETMDRTKLMGIVSTVAGILLIQDVFLFGDRFSLSHTVGNVLVLLAAVSESLFNVFSRSGAVASVIAEKESTHPVVQTTLVSAIALILCLIPAIFEQPIYSLSIIGWKEWLTLIWYGPFVTALAFIFWYAGIKRCHVSTAAALSGMMPFSALLLSVWLLGEHAGWQQWSGGLLVILGMVLIGREQPSITRRELADRELLIQK